MRTLEFAFRRSSLVLLVCLGLACQVQPQPKRDAESATPGVGIAEADRRIADQGSDNLGAIQEIIQQLDEFSDSFPVGDGSGPCQPLPRIDRFSPSPSEWVVDNQGLRQVLIGFDRSIIAAGSPVRVFTAGGGAITDFGINLDTQANAIRVDFNAPIRDQRVVVVVNHTVTGIDGKRLDGEVANPLKPSLPTGDGFPGGVAVFVISVLQGDADRSGVVDDADGQIIRAALGSQPGHPNYDARADLNRDGVVNVLDVATWSLALGRRLPTTDGVRPEVVSTTPADAILGEVSEVRIDFNEPVSETTVGMDALHLLDDSCGTYLPTSAELSSDRRQALFRFVPPLPQCRSYTIRVSNVLGDLSGMPLRPPPVAPGFTGFVIPPPPGLGDYPTIVNTSTVTLQGQAAGSSVTVSGPSGSFEFPVANGNFSAAVPLALNRANALYVTARSTCGLVSSATPLVITHDGQPPELFIDFPANGAEITTATTDVAGRFGDVLSGFQGDLSVRVNNEEAELNIGIGTNGTFFVPSLPLNPIGQPTVIEAIATDGLNQTPPIQIVVNRVAIPADAPKMLGTAGNAQVAPMHTELPNPIEVRVTRADGVAPFPNKIVEFRVTRSNGQLRAANDTECVPSDNPLILHCRTDENGKAAAFWTLGSDAGMGNNRVEVFSEDIVGTTAFCASATAGPAVSVNIGTGNYQTCEANGVSPQPLRVWATDGCNAVVGLPLTFTVVKGGGRVDDAITITKPSGPTGHAEVEFTAGPSAGENRIQVSFAGNSAPPATFVIYGLTRDEPTTSFEGVILDNSSRAVGGCRVWIEVNGQFAAETVSDLEGQFVLSNIPSGDADLYVDGESATHIGGEPIDTAVFTYPFMHYETFVVPQARNSMAMPVLLPRLNAINKVRYDGTRDVVLTIRVEDPQNPGQYVPLIDGLKFIVRAGTIVTRPDGTTVGDNPGSGEFIDLSLHPVHRDEIPMPFPDGAAPPYAGTFQPAGCHFSRPVEVVLPNITGMPAGAISYFMSFNHDTNRFEIVCSAHVTDDGSLIVSDPGTGITTSGWHGNCPPYPIGGGAGGGPGPGCSGDPCSCSPTANQCPPSCGSASPPPPPPGGGSPGSGGGDGDGPDGETKPIQYFSGEESHDVEDLRIKGRGMDFVWSRRYTSKRNLSSLQGNNWDYSYNVFVEESTNPNEIVFCNGNGSRRAYSRQVDGSFARRGAFRSVTRDPDTGTVTMKMDDTSTLGFNSATGSNAPGKLHTIQDRNGNTITLHYDAAGRLERITDTLNRDIHVAYNAEGFIETVTDFTGRQVRYEYYQTGESGGNPGDLKRVTMPAVTGTPNGNDFPNGKTTTYTYSTGFTDARLNGNMLTITDGKGQTYVRNVYGDTTDPNDINFDRVVRQIWGDEGDITDIVYVPQQPTPDNHGAIIKAIINDRVGNVRECWYNIANQIVIDREYTGRADPDQPTTETTNRLANPLRPDDPPYFETKYTYNAEYKRTRTQHPNGSITLEIYESDLNPTADQRLRGNLRQRVFIPGPLGGDQQQIVESFEYAADLGCGCGGNFVSRHTDGRQNVTQHDYDALGNRVQTIHRDTGIVENWTYNSFGQMETHTLPANDTGHRRVDRYVYYPDGPSRGYLQSEIVDDGSLNLATTYEYDTVGNVTGQIDPRGFETNYVVNQLNQVVRELMPAVTTIGGLVRYERDTWYDANNNVVRVDVQNVLDDGSLAANTHFSTIYEYETLNNVTRVCQEKGNAQLGPQALSCADLPISEFVVNEYDYDGNRNRTLVRFGEANNGNQPFNAVQTLYDERDLVWREVRAPGAPPLPDGTSVQSTTQMDYDGNRNLVRRTHGLEAAGGGHDTVYVVDGFSRVKRTIDPMGNETVYTYDQNGNRRIEQMFGEREDVAGGGANVLLSQTTTEFDVMDRPEQVDRAFFDWAGQPIGDGIARTVTTYTPTSQVHTVTNDNGHTTTTSYDTANRRRLVTDAKSNAVEYQYDQNSNLRFVIETEKHDLAGRPDELFTTQFQYDELNRQVAVIDNIGNTNRSYYDSRSNRSRTLDALDHEVLFQYDGLSRLVRTIRDMNGSGLNSANPGAVVGDPDIGTESIVTEQGWDDSSRLVTQTDDNGNTTTYVFDALNRKVTEDYADCTAKQFGFDAHDNNTFWTDGNENQVTQTFDDNDRLIRRDVIPGPGVSDDTTFEVYKYDGLSRLTWAEDDDTLVTRQYDSLSRVTRETQDLNDGSVPPWPTAVVTSVYDGVGNMTRLGYPSGRVITTTYDELERKQTIIDTTNPGSPETIATYWYVGPGRVAQREYGNGTRSEWTYDGITGAPNPANDFGVKRIVRTNHYRISDGETIDDRTYTWDKMGNKTQRKDIRTDGPWTPRLQHDYTYDNIYRLVQGDKSDPNGPIETIQYVLDGVGNRREVNGGPNAGVYSMDDTLCEPADRQMNQYTSQPDLLAQSDSNGNLIGIGTRDLVFDYGNRVFAVLGPRNEQRAWDATGRLVRKGAVPLRIAYSSWSEIAESTRDRSIEIIRGMRIDNVISLVSNDGRFFLSQDDTENVICASNDEAALVERYDYRDFGAPRVYTDGGQEITTSAIENDFFFGSRPLLDDGTYYFRTRIYFPPSGRFISRDLIGIWGDRASVGLGSAFLANNPWSRVDPYGMSVCNFTCSVVCGASPVCKDLRCTIVQNGLCWFICDFLCACETMYGDPSRPYREYYRDYQDCDKNECQPAGRQKWTLYERTYTCADGAVNITERPVCGQDCKGNNTCLKCKIGEPCSPGLP